MMIWAGSDELWRESLQADTFGSWVVLKQRLWREKRDHCHNNLITLFSLCVRYLETQVSRSFWSLYLKHFFLPPPPKKKKKWKEKTKDNWSRQDNPNCLPCDPHVSFLFHSFILSFFSLCLWLLIMRENSFIDLTKQTQHEHEAARRRSGHTWSE